MKKEFSTREVVAVAIGAALFAVLMVYGGIPVFTNTKLSSAHIVPVLVGALYGPIPAALVGFLGNIFADALSGAGFWLDWSIGNGIFSLIVGSLMFFGARLRQGIFTTKHAVILTVLAIVGNALSFGLITPLATYITQGGELDITLAQAQAAVITNSAVVILIGVPLLFLIAKRYQSQTNLRDEA